MEQRRFSGKSHWYHETQSSTRQAQALPLVPEAAAVDDPFLLNLTLPPAFTTTLEGWLQPARKVYTLLFAQRVMVNRLHTFSVYDRLSTALTVAQVYGVQRLCNHYAARLAPLPGPDSSRASNQRLAQMTQFARQLAFSPNVIDARARQQLEDVGLTRHDIVLMSQIIGFISFQARAVAVLQALLGQPVRWLPGMEMQQPAPPEGFADLSGTWQPGIEGVEIRTASARQLESLANWQPLPAFRLLAPVLAHHASTLDALGEIYQAVASEPSDEPWQQLAALYTARINGSVSCFGEYRRDGAILAETMLSDDPLSHSGEDKKAHAVLQSVQHLTCAPDRFSPAHLALLKESGFSEASAISLLIWSALCGWFNRLKIAVGDVTCP